MPPLYSLMARSLHYVLLKPIHQPFFQPKGPGSTLHPLDKMIATHKYQLLVGRYYLPKRII